MTLTLIWMRHGERVKPLGDTPITPESYQQLKELGKSLGKNAHLVKIYYGPTQRQLESQQALTEGVEDSNPKENVDVHEDQRLVDIRFEPGYYHRITWDKDGNKIPGWRIMQSYLQEKDLKKLGCETVEEVMARHKQFYDEIIKELGYSNQKVLVIVVGTEPASTIFFRQILKEQHIRENPLGEKILPRGGYFQLTIENKKIREMELPSLNWKHP